MCIIEHADGSATRKGAVHRSPAGSKVCWFRTPLRCVCRAEHAPAGEGGEQAEIDAGLRGRLLGLGRHQRRRAPGHQALHGTAAQAERRAGCGQPA